MAYRLPTGQQEMLGKAFCCLFFHLVYYSDTVWRFLKGLIKFFYPGILCDPKGKRDNVIGPFDNRPITQITAESNKIITQLTRTSQLSLSLTRTVFH